MGLFLLLVSLEFDKMKQNHTYKTLGEQNFILKIDLSNNEIPKAAHHNKKKKEEFNLNVSSEKYKTITVIYCQLSFICI